MEEKQTQNAKVLPEKKFSVGNVSVAIWVNKGNDNKEFYTLTTQRVYKDKSDKWQTTNILKQNDIPKLIMALNKAYEYLALKIADFD